MDANKILQADVLDIIFEKRNKAYGAYDLRKTYNKRMMMALLGVVGLVIFLIGGYLLTNNGDKDKQVKMMVKDIELTSIDNKPEPPPPPPPPPPKAEPPKVETVKLTPPKIVPDEQVKEEDKPPEQDKLEDVRIGIINQQGVKDDGLVPPVEASKGIVAAPKKVEEDYDKTFTKVEIESEYPGGVQAWQRYLNKTLQYPYEAANDEIQGTVIVQFVVDKEGNVSGVQAISGPSGGGLREEAMRVIKKSGKWTAAIQNGRKVKSYKKQPIIFRMSTE